MVDTKPITDREKELLKARSVAEQLPIEFKNGATFSDFTGSCANCREAIPDNLLFGEITRPIESLARLEAVGYCPKCKVVTPFFFRLRDNMSMEYVDTTGEWLVAYPDGDVVPMKYDTGTAPYGSRKRTPSKTTILLTLLIPIIIFLLYNA